MWLNGAGTGTTQEFSLPGLIIQSTPKEAEQGTGPEGEALLTKIGGKEWKLPITRIIQMKFPLTLWDSGWQGIPPFQVCKTKQEVRKSLGFRQKSGESAFHSEPGRFCL